ncbi:MAG: hypothetical protein RR824_09575 [Clostridia bacterium]
MKHNQSSQDISVASSRRVMLVLMSLSALYEYMYCTMLSSALGVLPVFGGALFMNACVGMTMSHTLFGDGRKYLTRRMLIAGTVITVVMLLCTLALITMHPLMLSNRSVWILFTVVLGISIRTAFSRKLTGRRMRRSISMSAYFLLMAFLYLAPIGVVAWLLFSAMEPIGAWQMLGAFAAGALLEGYELWRERDLLMQEGLPDDIDAQTVRNMAKELREVNAYSAYQRLLIPILVALQLTLVLVYTFIGLTTQELFTCMLLAVACTVVMREISTLMLKHIRRPFATQLLLIGLLMWLYGLFLFYKQIGHAPDSLWCYLALSLSVSGLTICVSALAELEKRMTDVAVFKLQSQMRGYAGMRAATTEMSILMGQMIALILLTILCMPRDIASLFDMTRLASSFRPLMIVPPLLLLCVAIISALHFPMNNRYFRKLSHWLTLESEGLDNPALKQQLESVVIKRHKNRFGVKLIIALLRPLYYHKVLGKENLAGYEDGSIILICNHGEIYGPVVANLYIPVSFRPWVIANMMDHDAIIEHVYEGTLMRQKWMPEKMKRPLVKLIARPVIWAFNSLEAIPVYRGHPRELMKTFRMTMDAMQAGDNILLFPENGEEHEVGQKGYVIGGVGKLYTGFAMLAPMYYAKTKKSAVFMPVYASKKHRTLTIGKGILYDPANNAGEEKLRIVNELLGSMQAMADLDA